MAEASKDTVYVDVDDEITSLIDKVSSSKHKIVALVLPKRAAVLQSTVNMRLLKRSADSGKKRVVLITSEASLLPLAGAVGLHVARNLQSRPAIPPAPEKPEELSTVDDNTELEDEPVDASMPVGDLAAAADPTETIELDNDDGAVELGSAAAKAMKDKKTVKKDKKLKVPDFDKFRLLLIGGAVLLIGLIVFLFFAFKILPKAKVTLSTDSTAIQATLAATTSGTVKTVDEEKNILPSVIQEKKQTDTEKVAATGSKDLGTKATGSVTIQNCEDSSARTLSSGITFVLNSQSYTSTESASVPGGSFTNGGSKCTSASVEVAVAAVAPGAAYNQSGGPANSASGALSGNFNINASDMAGGTTNIAKVVSQQDVDGAKAKITAKNTNIVQDFYKELRSQNLIVLDETATTSDAVITSVPAVGAAGAEATVTQVVTYSVLTINKADLSKLLTNALKKEIDTKKQMVTPGDVTNKATIRVGDKKNKTDVALNIEKSSSAIPVMNIDELKKLIVGKKAGDIKDTIGARPGIKNVEVSFSPFWVSSVPKNLSKTTITIEQQADGSGN